VVLAVDSVDCELTVDSLDRLLVVDVLLETGL